MPHIRTIDLNGLLMPGDLAEFLLARISEEEEEARTGWSYGTPARILAECDIKKQIISTIPFPTPHYVDDLREWESCPKTLTEPFGDLPWGPDAECTCGADRVNAQGGPLVLRLLASLYVDHPDYQEEWKP